MSIEGKSKIMMFPRFGKFVIIFFSVAFIAAGVRGYQLYSYVFEKNAKKDVILIIPKDAVFNDVIDSLKVQDALEDYKAFTWVSKKKKYPEHIKPGRYLIEKGMTANEIVNMLRIGKQRPVEVTFNNIRFKEELAGAVSKYIEADSIEILHIFSDTTLIKEMGFTPETFIAMFIPDTYEMFWTTTPVNFAKRMKIEYDKFWNETRKAKAAALGLTPVEVSVLASVVQDETAKNDEKPVIAGLFINRLQKKIPLQSDPTVKYSVGDFSIRRVLNIHLATDSPYNTYLYAGLPPAPINLPERSSIDAVLDYQKHNYLYMCAREDFSGYHNFARTLSQHNRNAEKYRLALNENKIWK